MSTVTCRYPDSNLHQNDCDHRPKRTGRKLESESLVNDEIVYSVRRESLILLGGNH